MYRAANAECCLHLLGFGAAAAAVTFAVAAAAVAAVAADAAPWGRYTPSGVQTADYSSGQAPASLLEIRIAS